ncbi:alpha-L-rhamnosidase-related protein [Alkalitalea saponilacus]|uniref:Alpha-L-rhamnosidase N-terminal domain-containing protein n=1 Tax=Alkalitalea saponilacus TaxID=889453 RepID=A0A1T5HRX8_9BACT|nr:alpha-L-rhamnosidase C-terminal domain-containing protein [Alkalitalea saponilacus]ASB50049.1 glycoside hydrolase [Alkalitalea saponilacus]SKC23435.1 Alpha-L-rhamnosidase N-terminal domain-containing protein [Alkalitalea saponilacus]
MSKLILCFILIFQINLLNGQDIWEANWITYPDSQNESNSWFSFRKDFDLKKLPEEALAKIAIDSKYWLWINGEMVVFEGGLKRGPNPKDTYYDVVDISAYLTIGSNNISVLGWYFGKDGFSHISSGKFGFLFECITPEITILTDASWKVIQNEAYQTCPSPFPNFRLPESSIRYDATKDPGKWYANDFSTKNWKNARVLGTPPMSPWNKLELRPIPQWKDSKLVSYAQAPAFPFQYNRDTTITCILPTNLQITPYLKIETKEEGHIIEIITDNFMGGSEPNVYAQYVSRKGVQEYESYGWMNGHKVIYKIPAGVKVLDLKYRETGYDTEFAGSFTSSGDFLNSIWEKAQRTLYITMRDNFMDCPDRERAQWWGDVVIQAGQSFYALDTLSHLLIKKGMYELINWQRPDGTLFSPIPAGNWDKELPVQMLTSIGYYGFWNYYLNTDDIQTISDLYDGVKKYLHIWDFNDNGAVKVRHGGWSWGDWGENIDLELITNMFYYLALKGAANMAEDLNLMEDVSEYRQLMEKIKIVVNSDFWNGTAYRHPDYKGKTDDRSQALAVVSGIADKEKYPALLKIFKKEEHASPYMEKFVLEALFKMGYVDYAIERMKNRYGDMVNHPEYTTLFEGWGIGEMGYGGGTTNHSWSGGPLTLLSQYLCGIEPIEPGYKLFQIVPNPGSVKHASATIQSVKGIIKSSFENSNDIFKLNVTIPKATEAIIGIPAEKITTIKLDNKSIWKNGSEINNKEILKYYGIENGHILFRVSDGVYYFEAIRND